METPIKCFAVESFGNSYKVFADQTVDSLYVQETLNLAKVSVFQFLYTEYLITDNWMYSMEWYLKKKGILRFELKKKFNEAKQSLRRIIELVESNSQDTYCNEYASQLDDMALPTLKKTSRPDCSEVTESWRATCRRVCFYDSPPESYMHVS